MSVLLQKSTYQVTMLSRAMCSRSIVEVLQKELFELCGVYTPPTTTVLWPFFQDHPGELVPEENFWTLWCKGRLTEADPD